MLPRAHVELTPFVGRARELAALEKLVGSRRLVTIVGPGGTGKTRLAVEVARALEPSFPGGVRFVDLAAVERGELVAGEVAPSADARSGEGATDGQLVIVDNCEHVLADAAAATATLLSSFATTKVIATSRAPLGIAGEAVLSLEPLAVPPERAPADAVAASEAARLLVDRVRLIDPSFDVTPENAAAVAGLCRQIDGLPLAIELVAPYLRALTPADVLERIRRFGVEGVPERRDPAAARQATLAAAIGWSYVLLSDEEQRCLAALSVFTGRFTLDAATRLAEAAGVDPLRAVDVLVSLVDKSLVRVYRGSDQNWYGLLEMVRSFAWATLDDGDDVEALVLRPEGELWRVGRGGTTFLLRDSKGLRYLRRLMDEPGREIAAVALAAPHAEASNASLETIDEDAKAAYRRRLEELEEEIQTADALEDDRRVARAAAERDALVAELARAVGLGGRIRRQGGDAERARMSVTKAIRGAIERIAEHDPELARFLSERVRTGTHCAYLPGDAG